MAEQVADEAAVDAVLSAMIADSTAIPFLGDRPGSSTIRRQVRDGRRFRAVKVALEPRSLERSLRELGWVIEARPLAGLFFPGLGGRAG